MADGATRVPAITIGVPVYNQAGPLAHALEGIAAQTFTNFTVLIYDNASTDETAEVARAFAARDPRFVHHRQPHNKGALRNFHEVMKAARSPYFLWRAADDYDDPRYLEVLHGLLEAQADKQLAVGRILNSHDRVVFGENPQPRLRSDGGLADRWTLFHKVNASWIYGLFRREAITAAFDQIIDDYGDDPWAFDYLTLLPFLLDASVALTDQTWFAVGVRRAPRPEGAPRQKFREPDLDRMIGLRRRFRRLGRRFTDSRFPGPLGRVFAEALLWRYANMRVYKLKRLVRAVIRRTLGLDRRPADESLESVSGW